MHEPGHEYHDYIKDLNSLASDMNADITEWEWFDALDGGVYHSDKYHIGVKKSLDIYSKRFTIAHELAHIADDTVDSGFCRFSEHRADTIATNILIADEDFLSALEEYGGDFSYLCPIFGVSHEVIERKYRQLFPEKFKL